MLFSKTVQTICAIAAFATPASAATFNFDVQLDAVTGDGQAENIGFFNSATIGDVGIGTANIDETETDFDFALESAFFSVSVGGGTAGTFFQKTITQDVAAGTFTVGGTLGGVTGSFPDSLLSAADFAFIYTNAAWTGGLIGDSANLADFLSNASLSGYYSGVFFPDATPTIGFKQNVAFSPVPSPIPLPAGMVLLLSGLGGFAAVHKRKAGRKARPVV